MVKMEEWWQDLSSHLKQLTLINSMEYANNGTQDIDYQAIKENDP